MDYSRNYPHKYVLRKRRFYGSWYKASVVLFFADLIVVLVLVNRLILSDGETLFSTSRYEMLMVGTMVGGVLLLPVLFLMIGFNRYKQLRWRGYRSPSAY